MLQNWFILLPELTFVSFMLAAAAVHSFRKNQTSKTFFTLGKAFLLAIMLLTVIFYNVSAYPDWFVNTPYTTLFKTVMYVVAMAWFYLSSKWFLNKNRPSYLFYQLGFFGLLCLELLISARTFAALCILLPLVCAVNWKMLRLYGDESAVKEVARLYAFFAFVFCLLLIVGTGVMYRCCGTMEYGEIQSIFAKDVKADWKIIAVCLVFAPLFFMLGLAPFHSCFVGMIRTAVLPAGGYLSLIVPVALLSVLMNFVEFIFAGMSALLSPLLLTFAVCSVIIGAFSANGEKNIRELFAFSTVYHMGFLIFALTGGEHNNALSAFSYMLIYILAMSGIYTVFLGMKSRGNYLSSLESVNGFSSPKPYMSAALAVFMFSLVGIPPMLGFLGRLTIINNMVSDERWGIMIFMLLSLLFMVNAYLRVVRALYFEAAKTSFDRTDKAIYICLFVNMVLVVISILQPGYLLSGAEQILLGQH